MDNTSCIFSYNSRGLNITKQDAIQTLLSISGNSLPIICNQENFLLEANEYKIRQCLPDHILFKPAIKEGLNGRPKNGMFIAVPSCLKEKVEDVSPPPLRIQSALIETQHCKIMLINTYFPQDPRCADFDETEVTLMLSDIRNVLNKYEFDQLIWTGDINADFKRSTRFVLIIENFIWELDICKSWDKYQIDNTHATEINGDTRISTIDHFFWNSALNDSVTDAGVLHLPNNLSDHSPIFCKMKNNKVAKRTHLNRLGPTKKNPCWKKAMESQKLDYRDELCRKLQDLNIPLSITNCHDVLCKNELHKSATDELILDILLSIETSANAHIPKPKVNSSQHKPNIPNWKNEIEPFKDDAIFWHSIWLSAGKPLNCQLHSVIKRT